MTKPSSKARRIALVLGACLCAIVSVFFLFYTARLLYVTRGLTAIRAGGGGAYVGALVFPLLAVLSGWGGWCCVRALRDQEEGPKP
jgi:hypothetical protein